VWKNPPGILRQVNSFLIHLNLEKDLSPERLVTIKLRNKVLNGWINLRVSNLRHQTQTRFCYFLADSLFFVSLGKSSVVASWQSDLFLQF